MNNKARSIVKLHLKIFFCVTNLKVITLLLLKLLNSLNFEKLEQSMNAQCRYSILCT